MENLQIIRLENRSPLNDNPPRLPSEVPSGLRRHSTRVAHYAGILHRAAVAMGLAEGSTMDRLRSVKRAALFHDIGKLATPRKILHKAGPLNNAEWAVMRDHPMEGLALFREIAKLRFHQAHHVPFVRMCEEVIENHHERWDGAGYPNRLKGERIPFLARLCAIADTYDAITEHRPYKRAASHERACEIILAEAGRQFDPKLVEVFKASRKEFAVFCERQQGAHPEKRRTAPAEAIPANLCTMPA